MQIFKKLEINSIYLPIALHLRLATMTCAHSLSHIITVGAPDDNGNLLPLSSSAPNGRGPGSLNPLNLLLLRHWPFITTVA